MTSPLSSVCRHPSGRREPASASRPLPRQLQERLEQARVVEGGRLEPVTAAEITASAFALARVPPLLVRCYEGLATSERHDRSALTMMAQWELEPLLREVHRLQVATLLLAGADDRWVPPSAARRVAQYIPAARFELWEGQGHLMHEEAGDRTAERLLRAAEEYGVLARAPGEALVPVRTGA